VNLERILARLKNERRRIEKAISALEKVRSAESSGQGQGAAKSRKRRFRDQSGSDGPQNKVETQERNLREEVRVVAISPATRRVS
jgi:transposase